MSSDSFDHKILLIVRTQGEAKEINMVLAAAGMADCDVETAVSGMTAGRTGSSLVTVNELPSAATTVTSPYRWRRTNRAMSLTA